jgi:hypothetical protein
MSLGAPWVAALHRLSSIPQQSQQNTTLKLVIIKASRLWHRTEIGGFGGCPRYCNKAASLAKANQYHRLLKNANQRMFLAGSMLEVVMTFQPGRASGETR